MEMETEAPKKKILIIEDDPVARDMWLETLSKEGYYVIAAGGTDRAWGWGFNERTQKIDMIIADQRMPGEEGSSFLTFLTELEKTDPRKLDPNLKIYQQLRQRFPKLDDKDFREFVEGLKVHPCIRVILSGYAGDEGVHKALEAGVIHKFISKKQPIDEILAMIRSLFEQYKHLL